MIFFFSCSEVITNQLPSGVLYQVLNWRFNSLVFGFPLYAAETLICSLSTVF